MPKIELTPWLSKEQRKNQQLVARTSTRFSAVPILLRPNPHLRAVPRLVVLPLPRLP